MAAVTTFLLAAFLAAAAMPMAIAQTATAPAPAAASTAPNLIAILTKGGQFTTFIRLLGATQVATQIDSQVNNTFFTPNGNNGITVFAPTDNAFSNLKPGTLNSLSSEDQVRLVLYHVLPNFYSLEMFQTASNPVRTQASGSTGVYNLNITSAQNNAVNLTTGIDSAMVNNALVQKPPLAVYPIDTVLLPYDLFGAKPPAAAPPKAGGSAADEGAGISNPAGSTKRGKSSDAVRARSAAWSVVAGVGAAVLGAGIL